MKVQERWTLMQEDRETTKERWPRRVATARDDGWSFEERDDEETSAD